MEPQIARLRISEMKDGDAVTTALLINKLQLRDRRDGGKYIALTLADRTGRIEGRIWDNASHWYESHVEGQVVMVKGQVKTFEGRLQMVVASLKACIAGEYDASDFLPTTSGDRESMMASLKSSIQRMAEGPIKQLMVSFFEDADFAKTFMNAPGAVSVHHNYIGGLLEHTFSVVSICETAFLLYPGLDLDLLIAGAILHDIGKIEKYRYDTTIDMSDRGHFMGHIALGTLNIQERLMKSGIDMPEETKLKLMHLILAHHGSLEWGSPVEPKTLEALILHFADNMDAKVNQFSQVIKAHAEAGKKWTNYDPKLGRSLYVGNTIVSEPSE